MKTAWILLCLLFTAFTVFAHETRPAYLELTETGTDTFALLFKVPVKGPDQRLELQVQLPPECQEISALTSSYNQGAFFDRATFFHAQGLANASITIQGLPQTKLEVLVRIHYLNGATQTAQLTPAHPTLRVEPAPTAFSVAKTYLILGIEHIWLGIDHLLFVLCLLLVTKTRKKLLITLTGFTLAHSLTLGLAALNIVRIPIPPVEAVIALSIVFLAYELIRKDENSLTFRYPVAVSASFGLLHGFGFAAVLAEIGLPQTAIPAALLFFNIGVEVGQILFVGVLLAVFFLVKLIRRHLGTPSLPVQSTESVPPKLRVGVIYLIGAVASFWLIDRVIGFWG